MPDAPDFIEAGFRTPAEFEASLNPPATVPTVTPGPDPVTAEAGNLGGTSDLFGGATGTTNSALSGLDGGFDVETRAPLSPTATRKGLSAEAVALAPLAATLIVAGYIWWRRSR